jgi:hypothetical protein
MAESWHCAECGVEHTGFLCPTWKRPRKEKDMEKLEDTSKMPFGKFKGKMLKKVPAAYFFYLWTNGMESDQNSNVADYIRRNLGTLQQEHPDGIWKK